jgi:hypothetical protein
MKRSTLFTLLVALILTVVLSAPSFALKVYSNPSIQTGNQSPDGVYNEGYSMQTCGDKFVTKCANRGFATRDSNWLSLAAACSDAVAWDADTFVAEHTNASGGGGWSSARGTMGLFWQDCGGAYDPVDRTLCVQCVDKSISQFAAFGRNAMWGSGYYGDCPFYGYHLYVLNNTPGMNAVLIEGLFHTNYDDVHSCLKYDSGLNAYAEGLYRGVCATYGYDPYPSPDIIIDNSNGGFSASASWLTGTSATDKYGSNYRYRSTAATSDPATWTPNISASGSWTVYAWWSQGTNRSSNSSYLVYYNGGSLNVYVNQQANGGKWNTLTTQSFGTGTGYPTKKSCWATTGFVVIADAVKWHKN